jgi:hypothetical protein
MRTLFFCLLLVTTHYAYGQDNTGFYIQIDKKTNCPQEVRTFDNVGAFCVPNKPILDRTAFTSVSEIQIDQGKKRKYIDLHISTKGMELLKAVVTSLPNAKLILVVDNKVVGVLKNKDIVGRFIRIDSDMVSQQIEWIRDRLKVTP